MDLNEILTVIKLPNKKQEILFDLDIGQYGDLDILWCDNFIVVKTDDAEEIKTRITKYCN